MRVCENGMNTTSRKPFIRWTQRFTYWHIGYEDATNIVLLAGQFVTVLCLMDLTSPIRSTHLTQQDPIVELSWSLLTTLQLISLDVHPLTHLN
jgi:hypothetical protein